MMAFADLEKCGSVVKLYIHSFYVLFFFCLFVFPLKFFEEMEKIKPKKNEKKKAKQGNDLDEERKKLLP